MRCTRPILARSLSESGQIRIQMLPRKHLTCSESQRVEGRLPVIERWLATSHQHMFLVDVPRVLTGSSIVAHWHCRFCHEHVCRLIESGSSRNWPESSVKTSIGILWNSWIPWVNSSMLLTVLGEINFLCRRPMVTFPMRDWLDQPSAAKQKESAIFDCQKLWKGRCPHCHVLTCHSTGDPRKVS